MRNNSTSNRPTITIRPTDENQIEKEEKEKKKRIVEHPIQVY